MSSIKVSTIMLQSEKEQQYHYDLTRRLPLKKRRFHEISYNSSAAVLDVSSTNAYAIRQPSPLSQHQNNHDDSSKISLVEQLISHSCINNINTDEKFAALSDTFAIPSVRVGNATTQLITRDYEAFDGLGTTGASQNRPRAHHPPLSAPIPGGCHGKTSRNNSYCRRTPCYNHSKYCKLHYHQYMSEGENNEKGIKLLNMTNDNGVDSEGGKESNHRNYQNKRFNELDSGEVQCLATTTRGRPCAYVAVSGTKYCHLHADYDTNPPPKRGGSGMTSLHKLKSDLSLNSSLSSKSSSKLSSHNNRHLVSQCLNTLSSLDQLKVNTESISNENEDGTLPFVTIKPHPKYPLLNSIPSDKWTDKRVLIGTGPLENHIGRVVKWGNGWVTVSTKTMMNVTSDPGSAEILHNRRAIELFLLPDEMPGSGTTEVQKFIKDNYLTKNPQLNDAVTQVVDNDRSIFDGYIGTNSILESTTEKDKTDNIEIRNVYEMTPETKPLTEDETTTAIQQTFIGSCDFSSKKNHSNDT